MKELRRLAREAGAGDRISFDQLSRDLLAEAYADADAVLFPALWEEPWGLVPLEAMSVGTPVVATGTGGSGEYLEDGTNCLLFRPAGDPGALASAVLRLAGESSLRGRLRDGGLRTAARFTAASFDSSVIAAVEGATSRASPRSEGGNAG
jgi:glycosyltransferase involved in cell wall biosynthesis